MELSTYQREDGTAVKQLIIKKTILFVLLWKNLEIIPEVKLKDFKVYFSNGKVSRDRMSSMGYYDDPKDYDFRLIYDCGICKGKGFIEIKKEQKTLF
jgi:hypothetical protein